MTIGVAAQQGAGLWSVTGRHETAPRGNACVPVHVEGGTTDQVERVLRERLGVECDALQVAPGLPRASVTVLADGQVSAFQLRFSAATECLGGWRDHALVLLLAPEGWRGAQCDNHVLQDDEVLLLASARECWRLQPAGARIAGVAVTPEAIAPSVPGTAARGQRLPGHRSLRILRMPRPFLDDLYGALLPALDRAADRHAPPLSTEEWEGLRSRWVAAVGRAALQEEAPTAAGRPAASYRRFLIRTREMIQGGEHVAPSVGDLCESLHVSPRTLQYAFQKSLGISVAAYVRSVRLDRVRRALVAPGQEAPRISEVAARWGFWHPSQFSRLYFRQFGELPSETVAQARGRAPGFPMS